MGKGRIDPRIETRIKEVGAARALRCLPRAHMWPPAPLEKRPPLPRLPARHAVQLRCQAKMHLGQQEYQDALSCLDLAIDLNSTSYKVRAEPAQATWRAPSCCCCSGGSGSTQPTRGPWRSQPGVPPLLGAQQLLPSAHTCGTHPRAPQLYRLRSIAYSCLKEYEGSASDANRVIQLAPHIMDGYYHKARL